MGSKKSSDQPIKILEVPVSKNAGKGSKANIYFNFETYSAWQTYISLSVNDSAGKTYQVTPALEWNGNRTTTPTGGWSGTGENKFHNSASLSLPTGQFYDVVLTAIVYGADGWAYVENGNIITDSDRLGKMWQGFMGVEHDTKIDTDYNDVLISVRYFEQDSATGA